ncbi:hypothetical protein BU16DRAFT_585229 [Lophium mytilinum]|uniref:ZZ-type domain-containing protein n=1 Tax=Lophium mytilinum TaxID=390894 RepID=A0A6A6QFV7_9PEZI|nr:hypothetical protein BU16DRAFT_585229 [Lophium mytilinum]
MSDPISVAGTAIGVVSLGLSLCQNLVDYVEALQDRKNNVRSILSKVDCLRTSLDMVKDAVSHVSPSHRNVVDAVEKCLRESEAEMRRLDVYLKNLKCDYIITDSKSKKLSSLISTSATTSAAVGSVLDGVVALRTDVSNLSSDLSVSGSLNEQNLNEVRRNVSVIMPEVHSALPAIKYSAAETTKSTTIIQSDVKAVGQDIGQIKQEIFASSSRLERNSDLVQSLFSELTEFRSDHASRMESLETELRTLQCRLLSKPDALRTVCDDYKISQPPNRKRSRFGSQGIRPSHAYCCLLCNCTASRSLAIGRYLSGYLSISIEREAHKEVHEQDCPFHSSPMRSRSVRASLSCYGSFLAGTLSTELSFRTGAGGCSIAPSLSYSRIVAWDSPAFFLLECETDYFIRDRFSVPRYYKDTEDILDLLNAVPTKLLEIFARRQSLPTDLNERGQSLCHVVMKLIDKRMCKDTQTVEAFLRILRVLVSVGAPVNRLDYSGCSPMDQFWLEIDPNYPCDLAHMVRSTTLELIDGGLDIGPEFQPSHHLGSFYQSCLSECHELAEIFECGLLSMAVLRKSEREMLYILSKSPKAVQERNKFGQTPLHLSCDWDRGMKILIDAGTDIDAVDCCSRPVFRYCAERNSIESLDLLLEAGCYLSGLCALGTVPALSFAFEAASLDIKRLLANSIAQRRYGLKQLGLAALPIQSHQALGLLNSGALDGKLEGLLGALRTQNIHIPSLFENPGYFGRCSIYHMRELSIESAETLYNAGFIDIDALDEDGLPPVCFHSMQRSYLVYSSDFSLLNWFLLKGANLNASLRMKVGNNTTRSWKTAHVLAYMLGQNMHNPGSGWHAEWYHTVCCQLDPDCHDIIAGSCIETCKIESPDSCTCGCSLQGCTSSTFIIKGLIRRSQASDGFIQILSRHCSPNQTYWSWQVQQAIRILTFNALGLRHTCCLWFSYRPYVSVQTQEEVDEIRDEDRHQLERFEDLVQEFQIAFNESEETLLSFFRNYWTPRIEEVLNEPYPEDEEEIRRIENIGVVLERPPLTEREGQLVPTPSVVFEDIYCDNCDMLVANEHFHCCICNFDDYDLCAACFNSGLHCHSRDHWMIKRFVKNGIITESNTEHIGFKMKFRPTPRIACQVLS